MGLNKRCNWSSLNATDTKIPVSYAFRLPDSRSYRITAICGANRRSTWKINKRRHQKCEMSTFDLRLGQAGLLGA